MKKENGLKLGNTNYYENGIEFDEAAYNLIFSELDISCSGDISCFSDCNMCFTKDELLMYLDTESTAEAASK